MLAYPSSSVAAEISLSNSISAIPVGLLTVGSPWEDSLKTAAP